MIGKKKFCTNIIQKKKKGKMDIIDCDKKGGFAVYRNGSMYETTLL